MTTPPLDPRDPQLLIAELFNDNSAIREKYMGFLSGRAVSFSENIAEAFRHFCQLDRLSKDNHQTATTGGYVYLTLESLYTSTKLFLHGYTVPSGNLVRHAIESLAMAALISYPREISDLSKSEREFNYYAAHEGNDKRARAYRALVLLELNRERLGIRSEAIDTMKNNREFYHQYSHPSQMCIAANMAWGERVALHLAGGFDSAKSNEYTKEMDGRVSLASIMPNFIDAIVAQRKNA